MLLWLGDDCSALKTTQVGCDKRHMTCHCLQEAGSSLPDVDEGDAGSSTADNTAHASTSSSSFSASVSGGGTVPTSPPGTSIGSLSPRGAADTTRNGAAGDRCKAAPGSAAAAAGGGSADAGADESGQPNAAAKNQQHWLQLVSAYPKVTVDTLPAAVVTAAGCSVCAGVPAAGVGSRGSSSAAVAGSSLGSSSASHGSVTAAARDMVALMAAPTLEVCGAAAAE
jgi:hypothetical protein